MVAAGEPLQQESVDQPAREPHPHAHPGLRDLVEVVGDEVVELAVEVGEPQQRQDPRDRQRQR